MMGCQSRKISTRVGVVAAVFCFGFFPGVVDPAPAAEKPVGKVVGITGTVEFRAGGGEPVARSQAGQVKKASFERWRKVEFHQPVYATDRFRTGRKSRLKVKFADNSLIALGPHSTMKVESYLYKPEDKLRQGVIDIVHGLSMYIVNKSQTHKKSKFEIVAPTGNLAARGTQGYVSATPTQMLVANQAGAVVTANRDPSVTGRQVVGPMMKNVILKGQPPTPPQPLTANELKSIRNVILARVGPSSRPRPGTRPLIEMRDGTPEAEEGEDPARADGASDPDASPSPEPTNTDAEVKTGTTEEILLAEDSTVPLDDTTYLDLFTEAYDPGTEFGTEEDYVEVYEPFDDTLVESCSY